MEFFGFNISDPDTYTKVGKAVEKLELLDDKSDLEDLLIFAVEFEI
jgi:hypothetical protein